MTDSPSTTPTLSRTYDPRLEVIPATDESPMTGPELDADPALNQIRISLLVAIATRCGQVPDVHPRLGVALDAASRAIAARYQPKPDPDARLEDRLYRAIVARFEGMGEAWTTAESGDTLARAAAEVAAREVLR